MNKEKLETMNRMCCPANHPMLTKKDLENRHINITCTPIDDEWKRLISKNWWAKNAPPESFVGNIGKKLQHIQDCLILRDRLLSIAGEEACMPCIEEDYDDIMRYGQIWDGKKSCLFKGKPSRCHENVCDLYEANLHNPDLHGDVTICTGYALSKDGVWRQHSWLIYRTHRACEIIETTEKRLLYFGFAMTEKQCERFCYNN